MSWKNSFKEGDTFILKEIKFEVAHVGKRTMFVRPKKSGDVQPDKQTQIVSSTGDKIKESE